jgi:hypothetical protein
MRRWIPVDTINRHAADPDRRMSRLDYGPIDMSRPFIPEHYTQLYYTPIYRDLCRQERLRYNQLFGIRVNEYIMMLEADLVARLLRPLRRHPNVREDKDLLTAIEVMIGEEEEHYREFLRLNRLCLPGELEGGRERLFATTPLPMRLMLWLVGLSARHLTFPLWYLMAMEESSMALARDMLRRPETETLGPLEENFVAFHREHMKDELRHVHLDGHLIEASILKERATVQSFNARLFKSALGAITRPERSGSGVKVIRRLVAEMPELKRKEAAMVRAVLSLSDNEAYQESLFNREAMPLTFGIFDATRSMADLGAYMAGYERD